MRAGGEVKFEGAAVSAARKRLEDIRTRFDTASAGISARYTGGDPYYEERARAEARALTERLEQELPVAERALADAVEAARLRTVEYRLTERTPLLREKVEAEVA